MYIVLPNLPPRSQQRTEIDFLKRDIPKINGSSAGFIALIVVLILVIMISCTAVFFLLRHPEPSAEDYVTRRQRSRHYLQQPESPSTYDYKSPDGTKLPTWRDKVGGIFRFGRGSSGAGGGSSSRSAGKSRRGGRRGHGWVQAGSGDDGDWDEEARWNVMGQIPQSASHPDGQGVRFASTSTPRSGSGLSTDEPFRPPTRQPSARASSIHLEIQLPGPMYDDPYTEALRHTDDPPFRIPRSTSPETLPESLSPQSREVPGNRQSSTPSVISPRTFEGGTKFIESL